MNAYGYRRFALIVVVTTLITSNFIIMPQHLKTIDNVKSDNETNFAPDLGQSRPTRAGTPWPMYLKTPLHESYTTDSGPTTNNLLWSTPTSGLTYGSPAVVDGMVFIGGGNGMNSYYANNGTLAWRTPTIASVSGGHGVSSSPAVDNGYVFFGGDRIYCLYANNGTIKWTIDDPGNQNYGDGIPTVANGKVFIGGSDRRLYCIERDTGNVLWRTQAFTGGVSNYGLFAAPAVLNGHVYLAACNGYIYKINESGQPLPPTDATINHSFNSGRQIYSSPVIAKGRVYFGNGYYNSNNPNNRFFCLNATDLTQIWSFYPGFDTSFFCSAGYYNDRIYVSSRAGILYSLNATGGGGTTTVHWEYNTGGPIWSSPAITNDRLYFGSKDNYLYCFNLSQSGSPDYYWRYDTGGEVDSTPAVSGGKVYVGTHGNGGILYCFGSYVEPPKDRVILKQGWNLISIPAIQQQQGLSKVLENISGNYDAVQYYNKSDTLDPWKHYNAEKPTGNDLTQINEKMGFWIHISAPDDTFFVYNGTPPTENQTIDLHPGWNLVGYPSRTNLQRTEGLNHLIFGTHVNSIWTFDAATQNWEKIGETDYFMIGKGYWTHAKTTCVWEVPL